MRLASGGSQLLDCPPLFMSSPAASPAYSKDNPFRARIVENRLLNGPGSAKDTRHVVVDISGSGLHYKAGDSLGVFPSNRPQDVDGILAALGSTGDEQVVLPRAADPVSFREALSSKLALSGPTRKLVEMLASKALDPAQKLKLGDLLAANPRETLQAWLGEREFSDVLQEFPSARPSPQELADLMRRLMPRLYSIASSPRVHPDQVQLTVGVVRYQVNGRDRWGVCSTFLADRTGVGRALVPVFVAHSQFGLPEDALRDVIMVGPGTGIAPFRAFVQDRAATGAPGRNWLFFGDQRRATDFLYEDDWDHWRKDGILTRIDTAFSRDQPEKIYVQDRMRENAAELWEWIRKGAYFYVCGDAKRMAKDVDVALLDVIAGQGGLEPLEAADYVKLMKKEKRYQRDVY